LSEEFCSIFAFEDYNERSNAGFKASEEPHASSRFEENDNILVVEGLAIDEIAELGPAILSECRVIPNWSYATIFAIVSE
jgi:hypothetical protein